MENGYARKFLLTRTDEHLQEVFPELLRCKNIPSTRNIREDIFTHLINCLHAARSQPPIIQWAALLHDIGKPEAYFQAKQKLGKVAFHKHELIGTKLAKQILQQSNLTEEEINYVCLLVRHHMFFFPKNTTDKMIQKWLFNIGEQGLLDLITLRMIDRKGNIEKRGKATITQEMKKLLRRIKKIRQTNIVFREELNIRDKVLSNISPKSFKEDKFNLIRQLMGIANQTPALNNEIDLSLYAERYEKSIVNRIEDLC